MHHKFIATVAAISILVTGLAAAPARAGQDDFARAMAAFIGLAIVGVAISEDQKSKAARVPQAHVQPKQPKKVKKIKKVVPQAKIVKPRPVPKRVSKMVLPNRCVRTFNTANGNKRMVMQNCLERHYGHTNRLPQRCERVIRTNKGARSGFAAKCLKRQGYTMARN